MRYPKVYGQSKAEKCPLCGSPAITKNKQGIPVCNDHHEFTLDLKCACGGWLDAKDGKFGTFFVCFKCGPISWHKAMVMNDLE
jgi:hypothetical protein